MLIISTCILPIANIATPHDTSHHKTQFSLTVMCHKIYKLVTKTASTEIIPEISILSAFIAALIDRGVI